MDREQAGLQLYQDLAARLWALFGGFVPFPLTSPFGGPSLRGCTSEGIQRGISLAALSLGPLPPLLMAGAAFPQLGSVSPSRREGRGLGSCSPLEAQSFHCGLSCWTPLPPAPGMLSDIPTKVGLVTSRLLWESSQLGLRLRKAAESQRSLCTWTEPSLTCLLLPEPQPPHLQLHSSCEHPLGPVFKAGSLRGPHACPCLPILLQGPCHRPAFPACPLPCPCQ